MKTLNDKKMQKINKYFSLLILVFSIYFTKTANSQINTLYFMDGIHQSHYTNPAFQSKCSVFIGLPGVSAINLNIANTGFKFSDIIHQGTGIYKDSLVLDLDNFKNKLGKNNYILTDVHIPIFGIGFWLKESFFTFDISNKTKVRFSYPGSLIKLMDGNGSYIGDDNALEINDVGPDVISYNEYAFGLSKKITHRLTIGGKFKILGGIANLETRSTDIQITTEESTYAMELETDIQINASLPINYTYDEDGNIEGVEEYDASNVVKDVLSLKNFGVGFDFGANYQFNDRIKFYTSITDLGFISWKRNTVNINQNGSFEFSGMNLDSAFADSDYDEMGELGDSIANFFKFEETKTNYSTFLPTSVYLGSTFELTKSINLGFLSKTYFYDRRIHQNITLSTNLSPVRWFSTSLSYSMMNRSANNFGLGFAIKVRAVQFYLVTDNINAALKPKNAKSFNLMFGFNLSMGCKKRDDFSIINNKKTLKEVDFM